MKRLFFAAAFAFVATFAGAQNLAEAIKYSQNDYLGTARSMALGNAMTALGGDLGSVGINPAGSAIAPYSQFTISPGISMSSSRSGYSSWAEEYYRNQNNISQNKGYLPNIGVTFTFDTYRKSGLKSYTLGFVSNVTSTYNQAFEAVGVNEKTSMLGSFAVGAAPYMPGELNNKGNYFNSSIPWNYLMAYQSGMIADAYDENGNPMVDEFGNYTYLGTTEGLFKNSDGTYDIRTLGALTQTSRVRQIGAKQDLIMNLGLNFNDNFFLGVNFGMPFGNYVYREYFREAAVNPEDFAIEYNNGTVANFSHSVYQYSQNSSFAGFYSKVGFIWLADGGFRIGAAFQTPSLVTITDKWTVAGSTSFTDSQYNASAQPGQNSEYSYNLMMPYRFNAGIAYTFWDRGLLSFDFEMADYGIMRYKTVDNYIGNSDYFAVENDVNRNFAGMAFQGRIGAELRLFQDIALRAGAIYSTSPEYLRLDNNGEYINANTYLNNYEEFRSGRASLHGRKPMNDLNWIYSFGLGYSSKGSFFADFAMRIKPLPASYFNPYTDYVGDGDYTPEIETFWRSGDMVLTLGWRF